MNKEQIASVIETSPVRLTSDETRSLLRAAQSTRPIASGYNTNSLVELGLMEKVPIETESARKKRIADSWAKLKTSCTVKDLEIASSAVRELSALLRTGEPETGVSLTAIGKEVARGITVRITKR